MDKDYSDCCVVSVAFRQPYLMHSRRQEITIVEISKGISYIPFRGGLPTKNGFEINDVVGAFQKSLYGFKPHAIQTVIDLGFKRIVWLDPSVLPTSDIKILFDSLELRQMIVRTGDAPILKMTNEKALKWFAIPDDELINVKHIGGTIYGFNFTFQQTEHAFDLWKRAEEDGMFGTQDEFMAGHWADESCLVLAMETYGIEQYWESNFKYVNQKEL